MKNVFAFVLATTVAVTLSQKGWAAEHGGKEHGGKEPGGIVQTQAPSNEDIRKAMRSYVEEESAKTGGNFEVRDPETNTTRRLSLIRVHERVGKTGNYYYSCADFKDVDSGEMLDLDLDVEDQNGTLQVVDVRIHKVDGKERYTYDENDNRIPVGGASSQEHGGEEHTHEHGGKEHGGR